MQLERAHRRDEDDGGRVESGRGAHDVEELLGAEVEAETRLGDRVVRVREGHLRREDRVAAVRDVRERPAVDERGDAVEGLDEVRLQRVLEEDHHRADGVEVARRHGRLRVRERDDHPREAPAQVVLALGETERRHDLRGGRDVETGLPRDALERAAEADDDVPERAVVHVDHAAQDDAARVDSERAVVLEVVVEERREEVVRRRDRMEVAREVEVDVRLRDEPGLSAAGRAALHPERRAERRLAQREADALADPSEPLREPDRRRRLPFARVRRRDRRDQDEPALRPGVAEHGRVDLGLVLSVQRERLAGDSEVPGDVGDGAHARTSPDTVVRAAGARTGADASQGVESSLYTSSLRR